MIAPMKLALLYLLCAAWDLGSLLVGALLWPLGARSARVADGVLWLDVRSGSLLARRWRYSTTLGHVVLLQPGLRGSEVEQHELVHVRQYEGAVCGMWLAGVAAGAAYGVVLLARGAAHGDLAGRAALAVLALLGPWWGYAGGSLAAFLRGGRGYWDNHYERHARAEVDARAARPERVRRSAPDQRGRERAAT
jgi:hypothetical protein